MAVRAKNEPAGEMVLCVIRHGDAGDALALPQRDEVRRLTPKGRKQAKRAGKALRRLGLSPRDVWSSKLARAVETADVAVVAAKSDAARVETAALAPGADPERIVRLLAETPPAPPKEPDDAEPPPPRTRRRGRGAAAEAGPVRWLVGHEPGLSRLVGYLVAGQPQGLEIKKGSIAVLGCGPGGPEAGGCRLVALLSPSALRDLPRARHT